ncbi:MAG: glycosyltransferase [Thaumarchaeota archaeon]|nr:glycosyltransferase [Nitrososphaerota archaeon]
MHGGTICQVLDSIMKQSYQDFEVIIVSPSELILENLYKSYDIRKVHADVGLLKARYLAHKKAQGDYELILDDSRLINKNCLEVLSNIKEDMAIIGEKELGKGFWVDLANLDKKIIVKYNSTKIDPIHGFLLPRYYKNKVLNHTFNILHRKINKDNFNRIIAGDHQLIYYESYNYSKSVKLIKNELISHFGDVTAHSILKKYYRYGKTYKLIKNTPYVHLANINEKKRIVPGFNNNLKLDILYAVRGVPFICGYILS